MFRWTAEAAEEQKQRVAAELRRLPALLPTNVRVPPLIIVPPEYVLAPPIISSPVPTLTRPPVPVMTPLNP